MDKKTRSYGFILDTSMDTIRLSQEEKAYYIRELKKEDTHMLAYIVLYFAHLYLIARVIDILEIDDEKMSDYSDVGEETLGDAIMSYNMEEDGPFEIYAFGKILAALEEVSIHFAPQQVYDL